MDLLPKIFVRPHWTSPLGVARYPRVKAARFDGFSESGRIRVSFVSHCRQLPETDERRAARSPVGRVFAGMEAQFVMMRRRQAMPAAPPRHAPASRDRRLRSRVPGAGRATATLVPMCRACAAEACVRPSACRVRLRVFATRAADRPPVHHAGYLAARDAHVLEHVVAQAGQGCRAASIDAAGANENALRPARPCRRPTTGARGVGA